MFQAFKDSDDFATVLDRLYPSPYHPITLPYPINTHTYPYPLTHSYSVCLSVSDVPGLQGF